MVNANQTEPDKKKTLKARLSEEKKPLSYWGRTALRREKCKGFAQSVVRKETGKYISQQRMCNNSAFIARQWNNLTRLTTIHYIR
jgi:hypothetical protein